MIKKILVSITILTAVLYTFQFKSLSAQEMEWEWVRSATGNSSARSIAIDEIGNIYVTGSFSNEFILDTLTMISNGSQDVYLIKLDSEGRLLWGRSGGGDWVEYSYAVAADNEGNVYITGEFCSNSVTFDSITLDNSYQTPYPDNSTFDIYTVKYRGDGKILWAKSGGGIYNEHVNCICTDNSQKVYIFGNFRSITASFDSISLLNSGNSDLFLVKYNTHGNVEWATSAQGEGQENSWACIIDSEENIYIGGSYRSSIITFGDSSLVNTSDDFDLYLVKYHPRGGVLWAKGARGEDWDEIDDISVDKENNIYITGFFRSESLLIDTSILYLSESERINVDMFTAKLDKNGNLIWAKSTEGGAWVYPKGIGAYGNSNFTIIGTFNGLSPGYDESFGNTTINPISSYDIFLVNYDSTGNDIWSETIGGSTMDFGQDICCDTSGNVYTVAFFDSDSLNIDTLTLINDYNNKMLVAKKKNIETSVSSDGEETKIYMDLLSYPNPFYSETIITYSFAKDGIVKLCIYDITGRLIRILTDEHKQSGDYILTWDGKDENNDFVSAGIYFIRFVSKEFSKTSKLTLMR